MFIQQMGACDEEERQTKQRVYSSGSDGLHTRGKSGDSKLGSCGWQRLGSMPRPEWRAP